MMMMMMMIMMTMMMMMMIHDDGEDCDQYDDLAFVCDFDHLIRSSKKCL